MVRRIYREPPPRDPQTRYSAVSSPAPSADRPPGAGGRRAHVLAWSVLAAVAVALFLASFERWGDAVIDLGRDLYVPSQILQGRVLYRQLLYNYGPAAPYLLAGLTAAFGDGLWVFEAFGIAVGLGVLAALYAAGNRLGGALTAFGAAFLFVTLSFFASSTWGANFVLPYSFAATLGTAFSVASFYFLVRYVYGGRAASSLGWSVALLFAAFFAKQETGVGIAAVHVLAWSSGRISRRAIALTLGLGAVLATLFVAVFAARGEAEHALFAENLMKFAEHPDPFFGVVAGLDRPGAHLAGSLVWAGKLAVLLLLAALAGLGVERARAGRRVWAAVAALALASVAGLGWQWAHVRLFQATPVAAAGVLLHFLVRDRKDPLLLLAGFALFAGVRVVLQFHPMWYGFYLVVPAYLFAVYGLGVRAARALSGDGTWARRTIVAVLAALAVLVVGRYEASMWRAWRGKTSVLVTAKGTMRGYPTGRLEAIGDFLDYAKARMAPDDPRMVVMPEGASLNYFTGFPNPTAYYVFTPPEIGSPEVERKMIRELAAAKPEYLLMTSRDLAEFGHRGIGLDYALELGDWIRGNYDLERVFESGDKKLWRLVLLRRRE